jgi:hypothetical protein
MASKLNRRYTIEPVAPEFPGMLSLWLRQKPESNEIIVVRNTRGRSRTPRSVYRTNYRATWEETMH